MDALCGRLQALPFLEEVESCVQSHGIFDRATASHSADVYSNFDICRLPPPVLELEDLETQNSGASTCSRTNQVQDDGRPRSELQIISEEPELSEEIIMDPVPVGFEVDSGKHKGSFANIGDPDLSGSTETRTSQSETDLKTAKNAIKDQMQGLEDSQSLLDDALKAYCR